MPEFKKVVFGLNVVGPQGVNAENDFTVGEDKAGRTALKLGQVILTDNNFREYNSIKKISDYLYEVNYDFLDYEYANSYFKNEDVEVKPFGCTSIRKGNFYGRNLDWYYNNDVDFIVRVPVIGNKHASIGVAGCINGLNKNFVESGSNSILYKILPFKVLDGINDAGVFCNINVVPKDKGENTKSIPTISGREEVGMSYLVRYILDNYSSAQQAVEDIQQYISIYSNNRLSQKGYDSHLMIGDSNKTYVLEVIDNQVVYKEMNYMTNFHCVDCEPNEDGTVYTPATQDSEHNAIITNKITAYGAGLERWNLIVNNYDSISSLGDIEELMHNTLNYKNTYNPNQNPRWNTEFVGDYKGIINLQVDSEANKFDGIIANQVEAFNNRERSDGDTGTWHTTHTSIYDLQNKSLVVFDSSESDVAYNFNQELDYKIPDAPDADGVYLLRCVVSNGNKKYNWVLSE